MRIEVGKTYKSREGRLIKIKKGISPLVDESGKEYRDGWNGVYWGDSCDKKKPKIDNERYEFDGRYWNYLSPFSMAGYQEIRSSGDDLIELVDLN